MSKTETLSIDLLRLDGNTQARIEVNAETVDEYSDVIKASAGQWPFEPVTVFHDGSHYWVADGFHRTQAALNAGRASILCSVKIGTSRDARIYGMTANDKHGLRMSREDRRSNVVWLIETYPDMTQLAISEKAGVSPRTVSTVVSDRKAKNTQVAYSGSSNTGVPSTPTTDTTLTKDAAAKAKAAKAKAKAKAASAAAKEKDKAAKEKAKLEAAAAKEKARIEAAGARQKIKDDAAEAKSEAKAAKEAAKAASLTTEGQIKNIKNLIQQHIGKLVRHLADLHRLKPNRSAFDASKKACEGIKTW